MSREGTEIGQPPIPPAAERVASPRSMTATSALVPPMSRVTRVRVRVQEADRHARDAGLVEGLRDGVQLAALELAKRGPVVAHPRGDLQAQAAWNERLRLLLQEVVHVHAVRPHDLQDVAEA